MPAPRLARCRIPSAFPLALAVMLLGGHPPAARAERADPAAVRTARVERLLRQMTLPEKIALLSGTNEMDTLALPRLGIPALRMTDGPHGVRDGKATCLPTGVAMGATWNPRLIEAAGMLLARETLAKGRNVLLGPCVNIHRSPLGGRNFESFGEDPHLAARLAAAYVKGVQSQRVAASTKHFACNNEEVDRGHVDVAVSERALHEIYLPAFRAAVQEGGTWSVMAAYNKVNGFHCTENRALLVDILKQAWGFRGFVVSDWYACHSTVEAALHGLDLEMPGPGEFFSDRLASAVRESRVREEEIDDKVRRLLGVALQVESFESTNRPAAAALATPGHRDFARRLAEDALVLLKNDRDLLPLSRQQIRSLAVIGPNAAVARLGGGGSSTVEPFHSVSPLDGLRALAGDPLLIRHASGSPEGALADVPTAFLLPPEGSPAEFGLRGEYFDNPDLDGRPVLTRVDAAVGFRWGAEAPAPAVPADGFSVRWTGRLLAPTSGVWRLGVASDDGMRLFVDGKLLVDHWGDHGPDSRSAAIEFTKGRTYDLRIEYYDRQGAAEAQLGWVSLDSLQADAVAAAGACDVAVVFAGLSRAEEGEGVDRIAFALPEEQERLIAAVAAANSNTVVVLINGSPVGMDAWLAQTPAVLEAWYPGQEGGHAIANALFGDVNPSGKLPVTFPRRLEDNPSFGNFPGRDGRVHYAEDIFVGYRHYDARGVEPLFPFGHGLSYTTFRYENLEVRGDRPQDGEPVQVTVDVLNSGPRYGQEVVQVYVADRACSVTRPPQELKGFAKVSLRAGERKTVTVPLDADAFSFYDERKHAWTLEPGPFEIRVGSSSRDIRLTQSVTLR